MILNVRYKIFIITISLYNIDFTEIADSLSQTSSNLPPVYQEIVCKNRNHSRFNIQEIIAGDNFTLLWMITSRNHNSSARILIHARFLFKILPVIHCQGKISWEV